MDKILSAKRADAAACLSPGDGRQADVSALEREIDERVYRLYLPAPRLRQAGGLTPEELDFIIAYDIKYRLGRDAAEETE